MLDWIRSSVDLPSPASYSALIPSFESSAALTCDFTEFNKLSADCKLAHALVTSVSFDLLA